VVIREGEEGDSLYIVEAGSLTCTKVLRGTQNPIFLKEYVPGETFGELSLLYNTPRAATITAKEPCSLWRLDRQNFSAIVRNTQVIKR